MRTQRKNIGDRETSKCNVPQRGMCSLCWGDPREARVTGAPLRKMVEKKISKVVSSQSIWSFWPF